MKRKLASLVLLVASLFLFVSCEKEYSTIYSFRIEPFEVSESGSSIGVTMQYLTVDLDWQKTEVIDNDGYNKDKILEMNDQEAIREFNENASEYSEVVLIEKYKRNGITSAKGSFSYVLLKEGVTEPLVKKDFVIDYSAR